MKLRPMLDYLGNVQERTEARQFPAKVWLYLEVKMARSDRHARSARCGCRAVSNMRQATPAKPQLCPAEGTSASVSSSLQSPIGASPINESGLPGVTSTEQPCQKRQPNLEVRIHGYSPLYQR